MHLKTGNILKLNSVLGGLTCELDHSGLIQEMVALAPKTYSQKILSVNKEVKEETKLKNTKVVLLDECYEDKKLKPGKTEWIVTAVDEEDEEVKCTIQKENVKKKVNKSEIAYYNDESFVVKAKGYTVDNLVGKIINFDSYKNMMIRGFENLEKNNNTLTSKVKKSDVVNIKEIRDFIIEDKEDKEFINSIYLKKTFRVKLNENISVIDNPKIFQLNWINDKRIIDIDRSNRNHIYTKPITLA